MDLFYGRVFWVVLSLFLRVSRLLDVLTICGTPMRSSIISNARAISAKDNAATGLTPNVPRTMTTPHSWAPKPAGVGANPKAVTSGWIRKKPSQAIAGLLFIVMPNARAKKYHSNPFSTQHTSVNRVISGKAFRVFLAFTAYSSSLPIKPPVSFLSKRWFVIL
jgi:hypothetical protein